MNASQKNQTSGDAHPFKLFYTFDLGNPACFHHRPIDGKYFDWLFDLLEGTGITFLYRCNWSGRTYYPSRLMKPFDSSCIEQRNPKAVEMWKPFVTLLETCDPFAEAVRAGKEHGIPVWAWWNWNEFQNVRTNWLYLIDPEWYRQPRKYWCTRDGSRFYHGVPDFGDEEVCQRLTGLARESLEYGVDGLYLSTRSHSWNTCWPSPDWEKGLEPFGFNDSVVDAYRKRHGVDIRYEEYDEEAWLRIKGEHFSGMLSRVGAEVHAHHHPFVLGIESDRYNLMVIHPEQQKRIRECIRLYKDWEQWIKEGSIDGLCAEQTCPHKLVLEGGDITPFQQTLPASVPLYSWADTACWVPKRWDGVPYNLNHWNPHPVEDVLRQIDLAKEKGARGIMLHSLYTFTACDTAGRFIGKEPEGYGVLPRTDYLDALREARKNGRWNRLDGKESKP